MRGRKGGGGRSKMKQKGRGLIRGEMKEGGGGRGGFVCVLQVAERVAI